jgi:hypothetical protein
LKEIKLTASEYHAISTDVLKMRMRDPRWKAAIYRLIKAGEIALLLGLLLGGIV